MSEKRGAEELSDEVYEKLDEKTKDYLKDHHGDDMVTVAKKICNDNGLASITDSEKREPLISLCALAINIERYKKMLIEKDEMLFEKDEMLIEIDKQQN